MSSMRQVALLLHGLTDQDRSWVLSQLESGQKEDVSGLLNELRELGMPADPSLAEKALGPASNDPHAAPRNAGTFARERVHAAQAPDLHRILAGEPLMLVAILLAADAWPWVDPFLAMQEPAKARRLAELVKEAPGGAVLREQVLHALATRLEHVPVAAAVPPVSRPYRLLRQVGAVLVPSLFKVRA